MSMTSTVLLFYFLCCFLFARVMVAIFLRILDDIAGVSRRRQILSYEHKFCTLLIAIVFAVWPTTIAASLLLLLVLTCLTILRLALPQPL